MTSTSGSNYPAVTASGTVTSWVSMDPSWSMPTGCSSLFHYNLFMDGPNLVAFDPMYGVDIDKSYSCLPQAVSTWFLQPTSGSTITSILPLTCPDGWITAQAHAVDSKTSSIQCCPSGYVLYENNQAEGFDCSSNVLARAPYTYESFLTLSNDMPNTKSWTKITGEWTSATSVAAIAIQGYAVQGVTIPTATATATPTAGSRNSTPSGGLSTGTKIGIGVGVGVGTVVVIAVVAVMVYFVRGKKNRTSNTEEASTPTISELPPRDPPAELHGQGMLSELADKTATPELPGDKNLPVELPDSRAPAEVE